MGERYSTTAARCGARRGRRTRTGRGLWLQLLRSRLSIVSTVAAAAIALTSGRPAIVLTIRYGGWLPRAAAIACLSLLYLFYRLQHSRKEGLF